MVDVVTLHRWKAVVTYRSESGFVETMHSFEDISDLEGLIERGPNWNAIEKCVITLSRVTAPGLTVEGSFLL